ncbi:hypothetical protein FC07_GL001972 [Loigolactobacillus bifermentans DSM 20003]|uniref:Uncharacterized protein n=1 Tax=Loigolactobacillus bifermentans DSM 20003 TaxID=1423726 RepID=A0A0R1GJD6_9LACO|nr:hypothetical protein FC07_GL001972 [Loigolactobacillus bifermentans DSM 20003]
MLDQFVNAFTKTKKYCNLKLQNAILIKLFGGSILKQKKVFSSVMLGATLLLLTSCGQQSASSTKSADKATSTQVTQKKSSVSAKKWPVHLKSVAVRSRLPAVVPVWSLAVPARLPHPVVPRRQWMIRLWG